MNEREKIAEGFSSLAHYYQHHGMLPDEMVSFFLPSVSADGREDYVRFWVDILESAAERVRLLV